MKWHAKLGTMAAKKCCFCEYWIGEKPTPVLNSNGAFEYDTNSSGICRYPIYRSRRMSAGATCIHFEQNPHIH